MTPPRRESTPQDDPLLDALLEEVLAGTTPPDLRAKILHRNAPPAVVDSSHRARSDGSSPIVAPPVQDWSRANFSSQSSIADRRGRPRPIRRLASRVLQTAMLTAGVLLVLVALKYTLPWKTGSSEDAPVARRPVVSSDSRPSRSRESIRPREIDEIAPREETEPPPVEVPLSFPPDASPVPDQVPWEEAEPWMAANEAERSEADAPVQSVVERVNDYLQRAWDLARVQPAPPISDQEWCQRVHRSLLGRNPSSEELAGFLQSDPAVRRQELVDRLLSNRRYREEYAQHWAARWSAKLIGTALDDLPSTASFRAGLERYLRPALFRNKPCDQIAQELLIAEGSNSLNEKDYNPATNYLLALADSRGIRTTEEVCRVMLGQRTACAQCHDDPHNNLGQEQFWQLTACFRQLHVQSLGAGRMRLSDRDFAGDLAEGKRAAGTVAYQQSNGTWRRVTAALPDEGALPSSGRVDDVHYRSELAQWLVSNEQFSRAVVNRIWAQFFEYGFTFPLDDMGRHNPAAHPELLDLLADEFVASGWDLNQLFRWVLLSDPFSRSDVLTETNAQDLPLAGATPLFSRSYFRPTSFVDTSQAIAQLIQTRMNGSGGGAEGPDDAIVAQVAPSISTGADGSGASVASESVAPDGQQLTIGQLRLVRAIAASQLSAEQRVEHIFQIALGRLPRPEEARRAREIYEADNSEPLQSLEKLLWGLVNTAEFVQDH